MRYLKEIDNDEETWVYTDAEEIAKSFTAYQDHVAQAQAHGLP